MDDIDECPRFIPNGLFPNARKPREEHLQIERKRMENKRGLKYPSRSVRCAAGGSSPSVCAPCPPGTYFGSTGSCAWQGPQGCMRILFLRLSVNGLGFVPEIPSKFECQLSIIMYDLVLCHRSEARTAP